MPTADDEDPRPTPPPQGPPLFVNPDDLTAQQYTPPTFVGPSGQPVQPPQPAAPAQPGAPMFVKPGGAPVSTAQPVQSPPAGYTVAGGGVPGGPTFITREHEDETLTDERPWPWWVGPVTLVVAFGA
ncbi:MAG: hypothetical protein JHD16_15075, partial [Solirubrobacteraceae bacterium]|nr:hypothetical protein [Solirubrobacteraceae bacterium]